VNPLRLARSIGDLFDELDIRWVLGGSQASSLIAEPRHTYDIDLVAELEPWHVDAVVARCSASFFIQREAVADAISQRRSFNMLSRESSWKVDVFVSADTHLDRRQMDRRELFRAEEISLWIPSPMDQILRKLWWYRLGHEVSQQQWRDIVALVRIHGPTIDPDHLAQDAIVAGVHDLVDRAVQAAGIGGD
jgi:hypothetical protein